MCNLTISLTQELRLSFDKSQFYDLKAMGRLGQPDLIKPPHTSRDGRKIKRDKELNREIQSIGRDGPSVVSVWLPAKGFELVCRFAQYALPAP